MQAGHEVILQCESDPGAQQVMLIQHSMYSALAA